MKFAIAGVSGHTGRVAAEILLAAGHEVRVIVRDAAKGEPWKARGATVAVADLGDAKALSAALQGVDGAYLLLPPNFASGDFKAYQARTGKALVEAVAAAAVPHVVLLSSIGAQHPSGTGPIAGLYPVEQGLKALPKTGASFVRAAYFLENHAGNFGMLGQGLFPSFLPKDVAYPMIATKDIGEVAAGLLLEGAPKPGAPRVVELGGGPYSAADVAVALGKRVGRPITVAEAPLTAMTSTLVGFGVPADIAALYQEMTQGLSSGRVAYEGGHRRATGRTSLDAFLAEALPAT